MIGNQYFNGYQPQFQNPYQERLNNMQNMFQPKTEIVRVNGQNGAQSYPLTPNSSILMLDENNPIVWLAVSDGAGYKTVTPYKIMPYEEPPRTSLETLEERISKLEELAYEKSDIAENAEHESGNDTNVATKQSRSNAKSAK